MIITVTKAQFGQENIIADILNAVTLNLLSKGVHQWQYPWDIEYIEKCVQRGEFYLAEIDGEYCGCFGIKNFSPNLFEPAVQNGKYFYHLAALPRFLGAGTQICLFVQQYSKENGVPIYFDCWAGNAALRAFYSFCGFKYLGDFKEEDYFVSAFKYY